MSGPVLSVPIGSIVVGKRIRIDLGDLAPLMDSLRTHGQLSPILLTHDLELIAGHRRLESARRLGWTSIDAILVDDVGELRALELEIEENLQRRQLSEEELAAALIRLDGLKRGSWPRRVLRGLGAVFGPWLEAMRRSLRRLRRRRG